MSLPGLIGWGVLGVLVGSFINVCADRLPLGQSVVSPPSHCPACGRRLTPMELIPVVSFLFLRGRCRTCGAAIGWRSPVVELAAGVLFSLIFFRFGPTFRTVQLSVFAAFLMVTFVTDLERQRILNAVILPGLAMALILIPFMPDHKPVDLLLGGAIGFGALFLLALVIPNGMGMGDVKLGAFVGLIVGYPLIAFVLVAAFILGGTVSGALLLGRRVTRDQTMAFGPFLSAAALVGMIYGSDLVAAWMRRLV